MRKKLKNIIIELTIWYFAIIIVKIFMNSSNFNTSYFVEAIPLVLGIALGHFTYEYFNNKNK